MPQPIRPLFLVLIALSVPLRMEAQLSTGGREPFFVAATPAQPDDPKSYSATLYGKGTGAKLRVVQRLFDATEAFSSIADDLHGTMYLAGTDGMHVIHEDEPNSVDFVPLKNFDDASCWGAVMLGGSRSAVQYCADRVIRVMSRPVAGQPRVEEGDWSAFQRLQYEGENGGPFQMVPPLAEVANELLVMPDANQPKVTLATLPGTMASKPEARRLVRIVASTDRYLALWEVPENMLNQSIDAGNPQHAEPLKIELLDRDTKQWRSVETATTVTSLTEVPVRILGDWMVVIQMHWQPGEPGSGSGSPGMQNERTVSVESPLPDVRDRFYNRFIDLYIPGRITLQNLADGRTLTLETGQQDTEVLAIRSDGMLLYRVNDSIFSALIDGQHLSPPTLVSKDDGVPEVHWAFWGPATRK